MKVYHKETPSHEAIDLPEDFPLEVGMVVQFHDGERGKIIDGKIGVIITNRHFYVYNNGSDGSRPPSHLGRSQDMGFDHAWCVNNSTYDEGKLVIIGPISEVKTKKVVPLASRKLRESKKLEFFKAFKMGVEVEGEFILNASDIEEYSDGYFNEGNATLKEDGSLRTRNEGYTYELVTKIIRNLGQETKFLNALSSIEIKKRGTEMKAFSFPNESAGTHVHIDFSKAFKDSFKDVYGVAYTDDMLSIFNSADFERFFFAEYFKAFRLQKYWKRLQNSYCGAFLSASGDKVVADSLGSIEQKKREKRGERYAWLNMRSVHEGKGLEFRIFPDIQTADGMGDVLSFIQRVLLAWLKKKATKKNFEVIAKYMNGRRATLPEESKLGDFEAIVASGLDLYRYERTDFRKWASFDVMSVAVKMLKI